MYVGQMVLYVVCDGETLPAVITKIVDAHTRIVKLRVFSDPDDPKGSFYGQGASVFSHGDPGCWHYLPQQRVPDEEIAHGVLARVFEVIQGRVDSIETSLTPRRSTVVTDELRHLIVRLKSQFGRGEG